MNTKIHTNISSEFKEVEIIVNAPNMTTEIQSLIDYITKTVNGIREIVGVRENQLSIINIEDIICVYSEEKNTFCRTQNGVYKIKQKLYEIEDLFPINEFIRISNSCIVNLKYVECFDVGTIGRMVVKLKDGKQEEVSKRKISEIMKILRKRRDIK